MSPLSFSIDRLNFARFYTNRLLEGVKPEDWFRMPAEGVTHIAWQVGHLVMAEYYLILDRVRGVRPEDESVVSQSFLDVFNRTSTPSPSPADYPSVGEIRTVFDRVHEEVMRAVGALEEKDLQAPPNRPHPLAKTKGDVLCWCAHHEGVHGGQIALLKRLLGYAPAW